MRDEQQLVFVGGLHRSGTTPLTRALASHAQVSGLTGTGVSEDEGQHLQDVYPRIRSYGGMGRFANAEAAHLTEESPLATPENAGRLLAAWEPYWDTARPYLVEKSPSNMIMGRFLQVLFPGSAMIVVTRHPVAVALALQKWNPTVVARNGRIHVSLSAMVAHWLRAHDVLRADASRLKRLHVLQYEELVTRPGSELARIQQFLGLPTEIPRDSIRTDRTLRYQGQWEAMRTGGLLARRRRRMIEERYGDRLAEYGYELEDLSAVHDSPWCPQAPAGQS